MLVLRMATNSCGAAVDGKPTASAVGCGMGNRSREAAKADFSLAAILSPLRGFWAAETLRLC